MTRLVNPTKIGALLWLILGAITSPVQIGGEVYAEEAKCNNSQQIHFRRLLQSPVRTLRMQRHAELLPPSHLNRRQCLNLPKEPARKKQYHDYQCDTCND
jgi:hypothetical protein